MPAEKKYKVYKHILPNGKVYIGITQQILSKRFQNGNGYKKNKFFSNAIKKYGWKNIIHKVLFDNLTKEEACQKEIELIKLYKSNGREFGYNLSIGGEVNIPSEEGIKRLREFLKGHKLSEETKRKISNTQKGKIISPETRAKMSKSHIGLVRSKEHIENNRRAKFKAVICIETGEEFESIQLAEKSYNIAHGKIGEVCKGNRKTTGGYHWEFIQRR